MITHPVQRMAVLLLLSCFGLRASAQTSPPDGLRDNTPSVHAFTNARIVQAPGRVIENGTLVIRDGIIESATGNKVPPADAFIWDLGGRSIYPGLIDIYSHYGLPKPPERRPGQDSNEKKPKMQESGPLSWNGHIRSDQNAADLFKAEEKSAKELRAQGFTSVLAVPPRGIFRGTSALVHTGEGSANELIIRDRVAHHVTFQRDPSVEGYPFSLMGVISVIRQTFLDADWYARAWAAYNRDVSLPRPEADASLAGLGDVLIQNLPVVIETSDERDLLRADKIAQEFNLDLIIRGSGHEYKRLGAVKSTGRSIILPVKFPEVPSVQSPEEELQVSLADLRHWDEAPENPGRLQGANVMIALTASELKQSSKFLPAVREAIERGLSADAALAGLTTTPAKLAGVDAQLGSLDQGKIADFFITDGDLFGKKTQIIETWIDGKRYVVKEVPPIDVRGTWEVMVHGQTDRPLLNIKGKLDNPDGAFVRDKEAKLKSVTVSGMRISMTFPGDSVGYEGIVRMSANFNQDEMTGTGRWSDGMAFAWGATRTEEFQPEPDTTKPDDPVTASFSQVYPPGAFGRARVPEQATYVLVSNATIWTSGPDGILENADMIVERGKITKVGKGLTAPDGAVLIDGTGKHVTPGLIDAHSHMAGDGGLNEAGQAISAEVRIGDVIDCDDIAIYRALAGGLTAAHVMHGSANPIGGQCQMIKMRWGMLPEEMKFKGTPPTIKFALGENVKQSNWGDDYTTRYPQTRMGVEQIMRDEFRAARDYEKSMSLFEDNSKGIPPRRDLELDAIVEILRGERFVHCHSYRQDEILATMRVAEDFGFRIRVFQHILEGYKVADIMARHQAGGSTFTDWWGYKFEVYDAIPYNGALMHNEGVIVSFNSDSNELVRRMNTEAAKVVKWGGVPEEEALKFVTINPARQLKIENMVGSLEAGKDGDFVVWSGSPLSTYSVCEQTWVDGRRFFDVKENQSLLVEASEQRATLVQKALATKTEKGGSGGKKPSGGYFESDHYSCSEIEEGR